MIKLLKEIIHWKCHICGREFDTLGGGICKKCNKPTCNICFGLGKLRRLGKLKMPEAQVCRACAGRKETKAS
jgi:hypothetical protein